MSWDILSHESPLLVRLAWTLRSILLTLLLGEHIMMVWTFALVIGTQGLVLARVWRLQSIVPRLLAVTLRFCIQAGSHVIGTHVAVLICHRLVVSGASWVDHLLFYLLETGWQVVQTQVLDLTLGFEKITCGSCLIMLLPIFTHSGV